MNVLHSVPTPLRLNSPIVCAYPWSTTVLTSDNFGDLFSEGEFGKVRSHLLSPCLFKILMQLLSGIRQVSGIFRRQAIHSLVTPLNGLASGFAH
jgi:hypothetical protein